MKTLLLILAAYCLAGWSDAQAGDNACLQGVRVARDAYAWYVSKSEAILRDLGVAIAK